MNKAIPQTADAFKAWADRECGKWPADLQGLAYSAWQELTQGSDLGLREFAEKYRQWEAAQS